MKQQKLENNWIKKSTRFSCSKHDDYYIILKVQDISAMIRNADENSIPHSIGSQTIFNWEDSRDNHKFQKYLRFLKQYHPAIGR